MDVTLKLITSKCFPILTYGIAALKLCKSDLNALSFAYNSVFVKLFSTKSNEIISNSQYFCGIFPMNIYYDYLRFAFLKIWLESNDIVTAKLSVLYSTEVADYLLICDKYSISDFDSKLSVRKKFWQYFETSVFLN